MEYNGITLTEDMIWALSIAAIASYAIRAFYCNTLKKTLDLVSEENRLMKPKMVWLAMIPLFSIYWNFVVASRMSDSLTNEFYDRKIPEEEDPGKKTGYIFSMLVALASLPLFQGFTLVVGLFSIIFFIKYWKTVDNFRVLLKEHNLFLAQTKEREEHETV